MGRGIPATKISSTGGFLRRAEYADEVSELMTIVRRECAARNEVINAEALPYADLTFLAVQPPFEVRVGGAVVFILPVERFVKT